MKSPVISANENTYIPKIAFLMKKHNFGCVIVIDNNKKPIGVVTEKDLVRKVLAKAANEIAFMNGENHANKLTARNLISSPLITVNPNATINQVTKKCEYTAPRDYVLLVKESFLA